MKLDFNFFPLGLQIPQRSHCIFKKRVICRNLISCSAKLSLHAAKGVRKGGVLGLTPPLELDILQKIYYLRKEINCFRILFAC